MWNSHPQIELFIVKVKKKTVGFLLLSLTIRARSFILAMSYKRDKTDNSSVPKTSTVFFLKMNNQRKVLRWESGKCPVRGEGYS